MSKTCLVGLLLVLGASSATLASSAEREGTLRAITMYAPCAPSDESCPRRREVRHLDDGYGGRTSSAPIFTTQYPVTWNECMHTGDLAICLQLDERDIDRWNSKFGEHPPRHATIAVNGSVIAQLAILGKFTNPIAVGQMDGITPPIDLEVFLKASSVGP